MSGSSDPDEATDEASPVQAGVRGSGSRRDRSAGDHRERALRSDAKASRKTLLSAARELFAESGPDALTIVEVAKRAGLNRSTAYQHFGSREDLTHAVAEEFAREIRDTLQEPREFGEQIDFFVRYFQEHPDIARLWMFHLLAGRTGSREGWTRYIESLERLAKSPGSLPGIDAEMLGVIGLSSALVWSVMSRQKAGSEELAETDRFAGELKRLFLHGTHKPEALDRSIATPGRPLRDPPTGARAERQENEP